MLEGFKLNLKPKETHVETLKQLQKKCILDKYVYKAEQVEKS